MIQYLLGHRNTKFIISLEGTPITEAVAAEKQAGVNLPAGGFDLGNGSILKDIKAGRLVATVDQQPYSQGFYPIMQLALYLKYGLYPSADWRGAVFRNIEQQLPRLTTLVRDGRWEERASIPVSDLG